MGFPMPPERGQAAQQIGRRSGLTSLLLGDDNPLSQYVDQNRNTIRGAFAGFGQGRNFSEGLGQAAMGANQGAVSDDAYALTQAAEAKRQEQLMATIAEMRKYNPQIADMFGRGGMDQQTAWKQIMLENATAADRQRTEAANRGNASFILDPEIS